MEALSWNFTSKLGEVNEAIIVLVVNQGSFVGEEIKFQEILGRVHLEEERSSSERAFFPQN